MRGFESTVDSRLNFGLGKTTKIDSVVVNGMMEKKHVLKNVQPNQQIIVKQSEAVSIRTSQSTDQAQLQAINTTFSPKATDNYGIDFHTQGK